MDLSKPNIIVLSSREDWPIYNQALLAFARTKRYEGDNNKKLKYTMEDVLLGRFTDPGTTDTLAGAQAKPTDSFRLSTVKSEPADSDGEMIQTPDKATANTADVAERTELYHRINNDARYLLIATISRQHQAELQGFDSAYVAYYKLSRKYNSSTATSKYLLKKQISACSMSSSDTIDSYAARLGSLIQQYNGVSKTKIMDEDAAYALMLGATGVFQPVITIIQNLPDEQITFEEVKHRLEQHELIIRETGSVEVAMYAKDRARPSRDHQREQRGLQKPQDGKGLLCNSCLRHGHTVQNCPQKLTSNTHVATYAVESTELTSHNTTQCLDEDATPEHDTEIAMYSSSSEQSNILSWVIDSGASQHITGNRAILHNFQTMPSNFVGFDNCVKPSMGVGSAKLKFVTYGRTVELVLDTVAYVPGAHNILSVKRLLQNKCTALFKNNSVTIKDRSEVIVRGDWISNSYKVAAYYEYVHAPTTALCLSVLATDVEQSQLTDTSAVSRPTSTATALSTQDVLHSRVCHASVDTLIAMQKVGCVTGLPKAELRHSTAVCSTCMHGKQGRTIAKTADNRATAVLDLIHTDIGIFEEQSNFMRCYIIFIDDYSRYCWVYALKTTADLVNVFRSFKAHVELQTGRKIKQVRCDNGTEYSSDDFKQYMLREGIQQQFTPTYAPESNGVAERKNRVIKERVRCILHEAGLAKNWWFWALHAVVYVTNRLMSKPTFNKTPYHLLYGRIPDIAHFRRFGCLVYVRDLKSTMKSLDDRSVECMFVGYTDTVNHWLVYNPVTRKVQQVKNVRFDETKFVDKLGLAKPSKQLYTAPNEVAEDSAAAGGELNRDTPALSTESQSVNDATSPQHATMPVETTTTSTQPLPAQVLAPALPSAPTSMIDSDSSVVMIPDNTPSPELPPALESDEPAASLRRSERIRGKQTAMLLQSVTELSVPANYTEALQDPRWTESMNSEVSSLHANNTGDLVVCPVNHKPLPTRWVYTIKGSVAENNVMAKSRVVVQGFRQKDGVDYNSAELYAAPFRIELIKIVLKIANARKLKLHQMDVKTAFLNANLDEDVYVKLPPGYVQYAPDGTELVWKLNKALYGLKQAPRKWYETCDKLLQQTLGFKRVDSEYSLYVYDHNGKYCILPLYVDDMLIACNDDDFLLHVKQTIGSTWQCKDLGEARIILGLTIERDQRSGNMYLHQQSYIDKIVSLCNCDADALRAVYTPAADGKPLTKDNCPTDDTERAHMSKLPYRNVVGALIYLVHTRPDIAFSVQQVCKYMSNPGREHWVAVKRIIRYIAATRHYKLTISADTDLTLTGYSDADYANDADTRRSVSGYTMFVGDTLVTYKSKQQKSVSQSTTEAEYVAMCLAAKEVMYLRRILRELGVPQPAATVLHGDNQSALCLTGNPEHHSKTKHISTQYHYVRDQVTNGYIAVQYVESANMRADILTKALRPELHTAGLAHLGISGCTNGTERKYSKRAVGVLDIDR